jgi:phage-related protein
MSDGRQFTSYEPSCELNRKIQTHFQIDNGNGNEYRKFLQRDNGEVKKFLWKLNTPEPCNFHICPVCQNVVAKKS